MASNKNVQPLFTGLVGIWVILLNSGFYCSESFSAEFQAGEFLKEYRAAIHRISKLYGDVQIEGDLVEEHQKLVPKLIPRLKTKGRKPPSTEPGPVKSSNTHLRLDQINDGSIKLTFAKIDDDGSFFERIISIGTSRTFGLRRNSDRDPLYLEYNEVPRNYRAFVQSRRNLLINTPIAIYSISLLDVVDRAGFKILAVERITQGGTELVKAQFEYVPPNAVREQDKILRTIAEMRGFIVVDPHKDFALREYNVRLGDPKKPILVRDLSGSITYSDEGPEPRIQSLKVEEQRNAAVWKTSFVTTRWSHDRTPANEFTLAAYGLGDMELPPGQRRIGAFYIFLGVAVACLCLGILLKWFLKRLSEHQPA